MAKRRTSAWSAEVESLYRSQARELWALFYVQCCDRERALDAVQEAFTRLQQQNGEPIRDKRAWLLKVGRNWLRDVARREKVAARSVETLDYIAASAADPSFVLEQAELQSLVRDGLTQLRSEDREVLVLRYALDWPSNRIGTALNISPAAVDMRLSRARKRLAEILGNTGVDHE
jgi:RNA polymerase sigma factor CnrH